MQFAVSCSAAQAKERALKDFDKTSKVKKHAGAMESWHRKDVDFPCAYQLSTSGSFYQPESAHYLRPGILL